MLLLQISHKILTKVIFSFFLLGICLFWNIAAHGATINVSTIAELQTAINNSSSGDIIVLANGTYLNNTINIGKSNITVKAATPGGVFLNGTNDINLTGNYIVFSGFQFISGDSGDANVIEVTGSHNTLSQLNFNGYFSKKYIQLAPESQYCEISYCNIENKPATAIIGCTVQINTSPTFPGYHKIRYCSFKNFPGGGGDYGNEPIRIGLSTEGTNTSAAVVEYCYFENTGMGDSETISLKCMGNVVRYCTFNNNPEGQLVFRHGKKNTAYGNFFINSGGIRVKEGQNHMIYNNYFQGAANQSSLELMNYDVDPLDNVFVYHNTFYKPGVIEFGGTGTYPPTNVKFVNNIIYKQSGTILSDLNTNVTYVNNIFYGGASLGRTYTGAEFINTDPLLLLNSAGYYGLSSASPAINTSNGTYTDIVDNEYVTDDDSYILLDIEGQTRPTDKTLKDIGCDEYTTGTITNHPLVLSDVGPSYLGGPGSKLNQTITFNALPLKTLGNPDFNPGATASSGLTVAYSSSNSSVATIVSGKIHISGAGTSIITASQAGDDTYNSAPNVSQTLTVVLPPSSYFDLSAWKLQTLDANNAFTEIMSAQLVAGFNSDLFYTNPPDNSMVFKVPSNGATTSGSTYPRTELRQMSGGANWELLDPTEHYLTAQCKVITVASAKPQTIIGQIHGSDDESELLKLRWTGYLPGQCFIEALYQANDAIRTEYKVKLAEGLSLGSLITYVISMKNGIITTTVNGNSASQTYTTNFYGTTDRYYFKAGNYLSYNGIDPIVIGQNQFYKLSLSRQNQTITFGSLPTKVYGDSDFSPDATSSSGLTVSYSSSNNSVATIVNGNIHIVGAGTTDIIASQPGDLFYGAASDVIRTLTVSKKDQTITFGPLATKYVGDNDFEPGASASSSLPISYSSLNTGVATIVDGKIHIVGQGSSVITASQFGDSNFNAAIDVSQTLIVSTKLSQTITFNSISSKVFGDADFSLGAVASSGLPVSYFSSNNEVATIVGSNIHIAGAGTTEITAKQAGNESYGAAQDVIQTLIINKKDQVITFNALTDRIMGDTDFNPGATSNSGLVVSYTSSNTSVAIIVGGNIHLVGGGTTIITASQSGDANHNGAISIQHTLNVSKRDQTITFNSLPSKFVAEPDFSPGATSSSGLIVTYESSNTAVATIINGKIHIVGYGNSTITALQAGNAMYSQAPVVLQNLLVSKRDQTITFNPLPSKIVGDADFDAGAYSSSGLTVTYSSLNNSVATILNGNIHIVGAGTSVITASQPGDAVFSSAQEMTQLLTVSPSTSIIDNHSEISILSIYPNPASRVINLSFKIEGFEDLTITMYNLSGQQVKTLINDQKSPGNYELAFDISDQNKGLYFVKFTTNSFSKTYKLVVE
ncbi:MAG: polysaccharide lyase family 7 protein [Tenuifilaceae bacterium]